ncbi:MAG: fibronectin type III domain-containing protein [archaeon]
MKRAQGSMEYLIIIAAVIAIAAIVVLFLSSALQTQSQASTIGKCKQAASQCKTELSTSTGAKCPYCYEQCVNKEKEEIFPGAYNFCLLGQPENIYEGSIDTIEPKIYFLEITSVTSNSATVTWNTDEPADSFITYAVCSLEPIDPQNPECTNPHLIDELNNETYSVSDHDLKFKHTLTITGLESGTTYFVMAKSTDGSLNVGYSNVLEFTTS